MTDHSSPFSDANNTLKQFIMVIFSHPNTKKQYNGEKLNNKIMKTKSRRKEKKKKSVSKIFLTLVQTFGIKNNSQ